MTKRATATRKLTLDSRMTSNSTIPARFQISELILWHVITKTSDNKQNENFINVNAVVHGMTLVAEGVEYST